MLLLSCERGQRVTVEPEGIAVAVLEVRGNRVRLGILAPAGGTIHRQEVWEPVRQLGPPRGVEPPQPPDSLRTRPYPSR
jgi:carbon storage regulator CsrA